MPRNRFPDTREKRELRRRDLRRMKELADIVGQQPLQQRPHSRALEIDDTHVGDVEHAGCAPHGVVLADLRAVLHRHVPPAEVHDAGPEFPVQLE